MDSNTLKNDEALAVKPTAHRTFRTPHGLNPSRNPPRIKKTAEQLAAESLAADEDKWIRFDSSCGSIDEWLESYKPSEVLRKDGIGWISVTGKDKTNEDPSDIPGLQKAWLDLTESGAPITYDVIRELALGYNVTAGKWLFHVPTGRKVDNLWRIICNHIVDDEFEGFSHTAKVSPFCSDEPNHVICVYNRNYTNDEEVFALEKALRTAGIKCTLYYKPDVYTWCGIYRQNKWGLRPTIFVSEYDLRSQQSKIRACHDDKIVKTYSMVVAQKPLEN